MIFEWLASLVDTVLGMFSSDRRRARKEGDSPP